MKRLLGDTTHSNSEHSVAQNAGNHYPSDEIDLRELMHTLWAARLLIISVTILVSCAAAAYAFLATPIYQTSVQTLPPTASGLASYNIASQLTGSAIRGTVADSSPGIEALTSQDAYKVFLRHLNSVAIRQSFFDKYYLPAQEKNETEGDKQRAWRRLNNELTINLPEKVDSYEASLLLEGKSPTVIAKWANAYVGLAIQAAGEELLSGLSGEVKIRQLSLDDQIATLREVAKKIRQDSIVRLQGALAIAESIGLESPADNGSLVAIDAQSLSTESVSNGSLLYLRGAKALRSEIQQLVQRKTDDAYIAELPDLLKKRELLNSINLNPDLLSVATIDRAAIVPEDPIKPQRALIVAIGIIAGLLLGFLLALSLRVLR